jgi:hypothetical protein
LRTLPTAAACLALLATCPPADAGPLQPLLACRTITDSAARLACFDHESAALADSSASVAPPAQAAAPAQGASPSSTTGVAGQGRLVGEFGLAPGAVTARESQSGLRPKPVDHIEARLTGLSTAPDGLLFFTLDNGQVWKQLAHEGELLASAGDSVRIARGWLGSYELELPSHHGCKVKRVR